MNKRIRKFHYYLFVDKSKSLCENFNELAWIILNSYICTPQKNDYNIINKERMTKADIVAKISEKLGLEKVIQATVETLWMKLKH
jgi:hypothetical protein